jgi:hypothetical protein
MLWFAVIDWQPRTRPPPRLAQEARVYDLHISRSVWRSAVFLCTSASAIPFNQPRPHKAICQFVRILREVQPADRQLHAARYQSAILSAVLRGKF